MSRQNASQHMRKAGSAWQEKVAHLQAWSQSHEQVVQMLEQLRGKEREAVLQRVELHREMLATFDVSLEQQQPRALPTISAAASGRH